MGFEPMNTGFADQRVSHFATGAHVRRAMKAARRFIQLKIKTLALLRSTTSVAA